jgi:hypothetical protein
MRPRIPRAIALLLLTLSVSAPALAQVLAAQPRPAAPPAQGAPAGQATDSRSTQDRLQFFALSDVRAIADQQNRTDKTRDIADVTKHVFAFVYWARQPATVSDALKTFLRQANASRVDQQTGAGASAANTSSVVSKTGLATLFGLAVESGAVTQTIDQNVATFRANADGLVRFLSNQDVIPACGSNDTNCSAGDLKNLELSASFNVSNSTAQTLSGTTAAGQTAAFSSFISQHQFSSAGVRYAIANNRDLRSAAYVKEWNDWLQANKAALSAAGVQLETANDALFGKVEHEGNPDFYSTWHQATFAKLAASSTEAEWDATMQAQLQTLLDEMRKLDPSVDAEVEALEASLLRYLVLRSDLSSTLVTDYGLTVDYTYSQPALQPSLHSFRVAYAYSPKAKANGPNPGTITVNGAFEFYQTPQLTGAGMTTTRWKDAQAAVQFDRPLGSAASPAQLSLGAYYQYQKDPSIIVIPSGATTLPGTSIPLPAAGTPLLSQKGSIYAAQMTLTLKIASSGVTLPIGLSWSNRSELLSGNQVSAHIAMTFDPSSLLLLVK